MYGWSEAEALLMNAHDRIPPEMRAGELARVRDLGRGALPLPYRTQRIARGGAVLEIWMMASALSDERGQMYAIATTERAIELPGEQTTEALREQPR
jgi:two-component system CheB/CheR fusion protein